MVNTGRNTDPANNLQTTQRDATAGVSMHMSETAPVSVIVPCFRAAATVADSVASVAAQTLLPAEVVLVDDGSDDNTLEELRRIERSYPQGWIKVVVLPRNGGLPVARNRGWDHATQPWVAFLDADDTWHPPKLQMQMEALAADPKIMLISHDMNVQSRSDPAPKLKHPVKVHIFKHPVLTVLISRRPFPAASMMVRRDVPFRFDEKRRRCEDFMFWSEILLRGHRCARINQVLASWHKAPFGAGGLSGDLVAMQQGVVDVLRTLHQQGLLRWWQWRLADAIGFVRYIRRHVITFMRRRQNLQLAERSA